MMKLHPNHTPALTVLQPFASFIEQGTKTVETRGWKTEYRGDLLICAGKLPHKGQCLGVTNRELEVEKLAFPKMLDGFNYKIHEASVYNTLRYYPIGKALCLVELYDCRPMTKSDEISARCYRYEGAWSWCLRNVRPVEQVPIKGKQRIFRIPNELITTL